LRKSPSEILEERTVNKSETRVRGNVNSFTSGDGVDTAEEIEMIAAIEERR